MMHRIVDGRTLRVKEHKEDNEKFEARNPKYETNSKFE